MPSPSSPTHNLTAAFLFLRTASTAVSNITAQIESTKAYIQSNSPSGYHNDHAIYENQLEIDVQDLKMWEARLVHAGLGVVNWVAKVKTGRWLPEEILGMIGERLRRDELVLPDVW